MKLTKYQHACFAVEENGKMLLVDPGVFTTDLGTPGNVDAIVITHEHPDHFDPNMLSTLIALNPHAVIYAHTSITDTLDGSLLKQAVAENDQVTHGPFRLHFYGGKHATIHRDIAVIPNLSVMINEKVYYPGDSFYNPQVAVDVLALPVTAPWMKIAEAIDFLLDIKPRLVFPTHDAISSDIGKSLVDRLIPPYAEQVNAIYSRIEKSLDI